MTVRAMVIVLAGVIVYANGLSGQFLFDDENSIINNPTIRQVWPLSVPLSPPRDTPVAGRPLVNLSFAFNYAASGLEPRPYRIVNLAVHLLSALALFGIIRRTLMLPRLAPVLHISAMPVKPGRKGAPHERNGTAVNLAFACALVWAIHPLNTEAVNYLSQRTELLVGLFHFLTLYYAIRQMPVASVLSCMAGMACKESMVVAPVMVVLYDRVFVFDSLKDAFRQRWRLYAGLAASWVILAALMLGRPRSSAGFGSGVDPWMYFLNQIQIIVRYLGLTIWPRALVVDYGLPVSLTLGDVVLPAALLIALGVATLIALRYRPFAGFLGAWFFITLAPTSSFVPISTEVGAERRMYLPLAALVTLAILGAWQALAKQGHVGARNTPKKLRIAALVGVCVLLAAGTIARNREYRTRLSIAETLVERRPHGRAHFHLGAELVYAGQRERALQELRASARDYPGGHYALATELAVAGQTAEAAEHAREFIRLMPDDPTTIPARELLARTLIVQGQFDAAAEQLLLILQQLPDNTANRVLLGDIRFEQRRFDEALTQYGAALKLRPSDPEILGKQGKAFAASGRMNEAIAMLDRAVAQRPNDTVLLNILGHALATQGRFSEAAARFRSVLGLSPSDAEAARNLAAAERLAAK